MHLAARMNPQLFHSLGRTFDKFPRIWKHLRLPVNQKNANRSSPDGCNSCNSITQPTFGSHFDNTRHSSRLHWDACVCRLRVCGSTVGSCGVAVSFGLWRIDIVSSRDNLPVLDQNEHSLGSLGLFGGDLSSNNKSFRDLL